MIRYRLKELAADRSFREGRLISLTEIAGVTGIDRSVLSRIATQRGYRTVTGNLDLLCRYFGCGLDKLAEYIPDEEVKVRSDKKRQVVKKRKPRA